MSDFTNANTNAGLSMKLWRGEQMALIGMDVASPEPDFVGFSIEVQSPGNNQFLPLRNRLNFSYDKPATEAVNGFRNFPSTDAPFQKFRWLHFPYDPKGGRYKYRVTEKHMPSDGKLVDGTSITLDIPLDPVVYSDFLDVGFTRNFASSQAYADKFQNNAKIIPAKASQGLEFKKVPGDVYQWLGFEAYQLILNFLDEVVADNNLELDLLAYDLNEPDIVGRLEKLGKRLRAVIDDSGSHQPATSAESQAAKRLSSSAGAANVKRMHFQSLQHNKVLIAKRNGSPVKILFGSTNFSFRGLYIQANNALVFHAPEAAALFETLFELAFTNPKSFETNSISTQWHTLQLEGKPPIQFAFSPHSDSNLALNSVAAAIDQAKSSVFFSIAFLNQDKSGPVREAINRLMTKSLFSYGISDKVGGLEVRKPDGSVGIADFAFLAKNAPEPFKSEWAGGSGIHEHHKFVVTDFSLPAAKVLTGSSNMASTGEKDNGDNMVLIQDQKVATSYAIEALRTFDHLQFRSRLQAATSKDGSADTLTLKKPKKQSGQPAWFEGSYVKGSQVESDRKLFSH